MGFMKRLNQSQFILGISRGIHKREYSQKIKGGMG